MSNEPQRRETADGVGPATELSLDVAFDVLADGQRRAVLSHLLEAEERADLEDLAHVAAAESGDDGPTATTLHHLHLPKLADAGLISYDDERRIAVAQDSIGNLEPYLEWARRHN